MTATGHEPGQSAPTSFGARLRAAMDDRGPLCAGIDPHPGLLDQWGLPHTPAGLETFAMTCVEAFGGTVAVVKPQSAFFEQFGAAGLLALERALAGLREAGTLSLLDVKRGDIGSTMAAYAAAYLSDAGPLRADAITVSPYLGYGSLGPALDLAAGTGRGVFVLTLTSNPEGPSVQHVGGTGGSVAKGIADGVTHSNSGAAEAGELGSVGMVVGATVGAAVHELGLDLAAANAPLLAPGVGAQGGTGDDLRRVFGTALPNVLASSSREVLSAGPGVAALRRQALDTAARLREALG
jgi:orotidine-5'-phosphate decarboxylase